jgi:hypothetical protein
MSEKGLTNDPFSRALEEAPKVRREQTGSEIVDASTPHAQPVGKVLDELQTQAVDALSEPFFDDGPRTEAIPVTKHAGSEAGAVRVNARRREPYVEASVSVEVKCDRDEAASDSATYHIRAKGRLAREGDGKKVEREFSVPVARADDDGHVALDPDEMRTEIATAIRSTGEAP